MLSRGVTLRGFGFVRICMTQREQIAKGRRQKRGTEQKRRKALKFIKGLVW